MRVLYSIISLLITIGSPLPVHAGEVGSRSSSESHLRDLENMGESIGVQMAAVNRVVDQLATILSDETRSSDERIQAAIQIERAGTPQALAFLVKNIGLQVPVRMIARENDRVRRYPCYYALTGMDSRRANWAAVPLLIEHASAITAAESQELSVVASCLVCICGRRAAIEIVTSRIQSTSGENGKRGLDSLRRVLQQ